MDNNIHKKIQTFRSAKDLLKINVDAGTAAGFSGVIKKAETPLQHALNEIYRTVLNVEIGIDVDFFSAGGTSFKAVQISSKLYKLGYEVKIHEVFIYNTIQKLSGFIESHSRSIPFNIPIQQEKQYYELSEAQKRFWILNKLQGGSQAYNLSMAYYLDGVLSITKLEKAFKAIIERHEILRTIFIEIEGEPKQKILSFEQLNFSIEHIELDNHDKNHREEFVKNQAKIDFDFEKGPLIVVKVIKYAEHKSILLLVVPHIITDGWSLVNLSNEISFFYDAADDEYLPGLKFQYKDVVNWQLLEKENERYIIARNYWMDKFSDYTPLKLVADYSKPKLRSFKGGNISFPISSEMYYKITDVLKLSELSLQMFFLAILKVLLHRHTNQNSITIGTIVSGRQEQEFHDQMGPYVNTLALKTLIDDQDTIKDVFHKVRTTVVDAFKFQSYSSYDLAKELEKHALNNSLLEVMLIMQNTLSSNGLPDNIAGIHLEPMELSETVSRFDLSFHVTESMSGMTLDIHYNLDLYRKERIELIGEEFMNLITLFTGNVDHRLKELSFESKLQQDLDSDFEFNF